MEPILSSTQSTDGLPAEAAELPVPPGRVEELLRALSTAIRNHRLYGDDSPMQERFTAALQQKFVPLWEDLDELRLEVQEQRFQWESLPVYPPAGESADLPFQFYKDGIRELVFRRGFEDEAPAFVRVVARASQLRNDEDDLITLLWAEDFQRLAYTSVEPEGQTLELPGGASSAPDPVDATDVRAVAASPEGRLSADDFQDTLYFLEEAELRRLNEELDRELNRDLWGEVLAALMDRLEDGTLERQQRIVRICAELLSSALGAGRLERAASLLREMVEIAGRPGLLPPPVLREARALFSQLGAPSTVAQLVQILEDSPETLHHEHLALLLGFFPREALAPLMRSVEAVVRPDVRRAVERAIEKVATSHRDEVIRLLGDPDSRVVIGAVRWVGRLGVGSAVGRLTEFLDAPDVAMRLAAIGALADLKAASAGRELVPLLEAPERDVRIAAARALAALSYTAASAALEKALTSKRLRAADRTEKLAFFEAFGQLAGAEGVGLLDRTLNARGFLGRAEPTEIRACAALALARVSHPSAHEALSRAAADDDPVVRSAVARSLRGEGAA